MDAWVELGGTSGINLRMFKITWLMIFSFYIFHVWRHVSGVYQPRLPMPRGSHWPCHWRQQQWMAGCQCRSCHKALQARTSWIFMAVQRLILAYRAPSFGTSGAGDYIVLVSVGFCMLLCFFPTSPRWNPPSLPDVGFGWFRHQRFLVDDEHYPLVITTSTVCGLENHHVWKR